METKRTISIGVEGTPDTLLIRHLQAMAHSRFRFNDSNTVLVESSHGQNSVDVVKMAMLHDADQKIALIDRDRWNMHPKEESQARKLANPNGVELIILEPCLDSVILSILGDDSELASPTCAGAKVKLARLLNPPTSKRIIFSDLLARRASGAKLNAVKSKNSGLGTLMDVFGI